MTVLQYQQPQKQERQGDTMTPEIIQTLIGNYGFPIACCAFLAWYQVKKIDVFTDTMTRNNALLDKLLDKLDEKKEE